MKVLVTGATGFIGSSVLKRLVNEGYETAALVRAHSNLEAISDFADKVELRYGDVTDAGSVSNAMKGISHVYHCAGVARIGPGHDDLLYKVNVEGTRSVLREAMRNDVERVVFTSSVSAVGITGSKKPANEDQVWNLDKLNVTYFKTKHLAEQEVSQAVKQGLDCVTVNPSYVFGPGDINFNAGRLIRDLYHRKIPFYPIGGVCVVDIDVVVDGHLAAMKKGRMGERYILGGENISYKTVFDTICNIVGAPKVSIPMLPALIKMFIKVTENARKLKKVSALINQEILASSSKYLYYDSSKARRELGLGEKTFEESIRNTFHWYKSLRLL
ncbi:MAG: SDR family NAD(P)-dependent oxidoreductase [Chlorobiales bacterium]|nr:SDR family NAD(P)-dependent oxidoreductase [Chlorobiales bacterium]